MKVIRKALTAAGFGLAAALGASMLDGSLTGAEATVAVGMGLLAGVAVYRIPNGDTPPGEHRASL